MIAKASLAGLAQGRFHRNFWKYRTHAKAYRALRRTHTSHSNRAPSHTLMHSTQRSR